MYHVPVEVEKNINIVVEKKLNKYGFLPRIGQYMKTEGLKAPSRDGIHDFSKSHLIYLKHIEPSKPRFKT